MTTALGRLTPEQEIEWLAQPRDTGELMWAAGFFDGEGSVYVHHRANKIGHHTAGERAVIGITVGQSYVTEELERFRRAVGLDTVKIQGPFRSDKSTAPRFRFVVVGKRAHLVMRLLLPHLCSRKREKYLYLVASKGV